MTPDEGVNGRRRGTHFHKAINCWPSGHRHLIRRSLSGPTHQALPRPVNSARLPSVSSVDSVIKPFHLNPDSRAAAVAHRHQPQTSDNQHDESTGQSTLELRHRWPASHDGPEINLRYISAPEISTSAGPNLATDNRRSFGH